MVSNIFLFTPIWGRFPIWLFCSDGLKPPTSNWCLIFNMMYVMYAISTGRFTRKTLQFKTLANILVELTTTKNSTQPQWLSLSPLYGFTNIWEISPAGNFEDLHLFPADAGVPLGRLLPWFFSSSQGAPRVLWKAVPTLWLATSTTGWDGTPCRWWYRRTNTPPKRLSNSKGILQNWNASGRISGKCLAGLHQIMIKNSPSLIYYTGLCFGMFFCSFVFGAFLGKAASQ